MRLRFPLYAKVLFWLFVNLLLIAALAAIFLRTQFRLRMDSLLSGAVGQRLEAMSEVISADLRERPKERWGEVLSRYSEANGATFALFRNDSQQLAGTPIEPPPEVREKMRDRQRGQGAPPRRDGRPDAPPGDNSRNAQGPPGDHRPPPPPPRPEGEQGERPHPPGQAPAPPPPSARLNFFLRAGEPAKYWAGIRIELPHDEPGNGRTAMLVVVTDSITRGGLFFEPWPWIIFIAAAIVISALVWLPIVGGITRAIRRMNTAAHSITEGRFDVRVPAQRRDELGELAGSVNTMAAQLGDFVERQRRLTADVAHELCSPIARMQRAMGVVEQRATPEQAGYLEKLNRELQHMAALVEEVLAFSKAATVPRQASAEDFDLEKLVAEVVTGEAPESQVEVHIPAGLRLRTYREALDRALANVVRNAVRYAGQAGPIEIRASEAADRVEIDIRDHGPGVPARALEQIFEPFFRPEMARQRTTGGAGLGLAIVRSISAAHGGTVEVESAVGAGSRFRVTLPLAPA